MKPCSYPIEDLIAHRPPMILIDRVVSYDEETAEVRVMIREDSPFIRDEGMPSYVTIEYMGQAIAAYSGLQALEKGEKVRIGFLLGTRILKLHTPCLSVGTELVVNVRALYNDGEMAAFECQTLMGDFLVSEATINVYQPGNDNPEDPNNNEDNT